MNESQENKYGPGPSSSMEAPREEFYSSFIDKKAIHMMEKMGFKLGVGLGKYEQGITQAVELTSKSGKRGFGFTHSIQSQIEWDFSKDDINVEECIEWLENSIHLDYTFEKLQSFLKIGDSDEVQLTSYDFCDRSIYDEVKKAKIIFDESDINDLNKARTKANPFEKIHSVFFMNRAALKLANIDAATNFMFSNIDSDSYHCDSDKPLYFADVCAGPGGFSEYILWRRSWFFKGFGLTLKDENDFKLYTSCCASPHSFQAFYGSEEDGNVCNPDNIQNFKEKVMFQTKNIGVHFMSSDGGFCVDGNEDYQEMLSKNIYLCQCLVALEIVRKHGHFVTKLFDIFTRFSVGLIYLMYKCFKKVSIIKPNSSRPANAERYLICCDLQDNSDVESIRGYLRFVSKKLWKLQDEEQIDVLELVPLKQLKRDVLFSDYVMKINNKIGQYQIQALKKLGAFCQNPKLKEARQDELRTKCLEYWQIPDLTKFQYDLRNTKLNEFLDNFVQQEDWLKDPPRKIDTQKAIQKVMRNKKYWSFCALYSSHEKKLCNIYAGFTSKSCKWQNDRWTKVKNLKLSKGTLLYGELLKEVIQLDGKDEDFECYSRYSLHIIDAMYLGDVCLLDHCFEKRMKLISIYAESINQEFQERIIRIRKKPTFPLTSYNFSDLLKRNCDDTTFRISLPIIGYKSEEEYQDVSSVMLLNHGEGQTWKAAFIQRAQLNLEDDVLKDILMSDMYEKLKDKDNDQT